MGLAPKQPSFRLQPQGGKPFVVKLREQETPNAETMMLGTVSGRDALFQINNNLVSRLPKNINQVRYPHLADINTATVARIQIDSSLDSVDLRRMRETGKQWRLVLGGANQPANQDKIDRLLGALNTETIVDYRSDTASRLEEFGLDRPLASIAITTSLVDGDELDRYQEKVAEAKKAGQDPEAIKKPKVEVKTRTIRFGRKGDVLLNAKFDDEPFIYAIDPAFLSIYVPNPPHCLAGLGSIGF